MATIPSGTSRRVFVKAGALALVGLAAPPRFLVRAASAERVAGRRRVLVALFQRGAVDGLSMIVPHGDSAYYAARAGIAIPRPEPARADVSVDLDGFFGLHPALAPLKSLWDEGRLAAVHACGSPDSTRSHFDAQDFMEAGTPGVKSTPDGWLTRALAASAAPPSAFRAVALGSVLPRSLRGQPGALALSSVRDFSVGQAAGMPPEARGARQAFEALYAERAAGPLRETGHESFEAMRALQAAAPERFTPANGARYPRSRTGEGLRQIAQLIKADVGLEVGFVDSGGWDTHAAQGNERGLLAGRFTDLAESLTAFDRDLGARMADVVVLTMSEFGRTVRENGNRGTDHGHCTAMLVLGGAVRGGRILGRWPGLAPEQLYERRDLAVTTDFRDLFAEVAARHLGLAGGARLFPGFSTDPAARPGLFA
jgi:uncharacterized protein (DUF1501 family)